MQALAMNKAIASSMTVERDRIAIDQIRFAGDVGKLGDSLPRRRDHGRSHGGAGHLFHRLLRRSIGRR